VNDFESGAGSEWDNRTAEVTPTGARSFLGRFGNQTVTLNLTNLPSHNEVLLSFDLFVIQSWDGNDAIAGRGPDIWGVSVVNGPNLACTTFATHQGPTQPGYQAYPENYPNGKHPVNTGASEITHWDISSIFPRGEVFLPTPFIK
jgi:hypothetical protein